MSVTERIRVYVAVYDGGSEGTEVLGVCRDDRHSMGLCVTKVREKLIAQMQPQPEGYEPTDFVEETVDAIGCDEDDLLTLYDDDASIDDRYAAAQAIIPWLTEEQGSVESQRFDLL